MARPLGSRNKAKAKVDKFLTKEFKDLERLKALAERQDEVVQQGLDEIADLRRKVEFYRKQVNHLIALLNIITKES